MQYIEGIAYNFFEIDAGVRQEKFNGDLNLQHHGILGYLTAKFW